MEERPEEPQNSEAIASLAARLPYELRDRWLLIFDFDGTLSAIAPRPEDAVIDARLIKILEPLRSLIGWLVVVSGRDRESLGRLLPAGWLAVGSYGLELPPELDPSGHPPGFDPATAEAALAQARPALADLSRRWPGARLEAKRWGLAMHFRGMPNPPDGDEVRAALQPIADSSGLALVAGRLVYELRPGYGVDKGWVVRYLLERLDPAAALFVGDDVADTPAWEALLDASSRIPTLALGVASGETPPGLLNICDAVLPNREALVTFCAALLSEVG